MRTLWLLANWKMHHTADSAQSFIKSFEAEYGAHFDKIEIGVCAPSPLLPACSEVASKLRVGAQNVFHEEKGAFTGENSCSILESIGVKLSLVGHSERRKTFGESDSDCSERALGALSQGLSVVFCCGETLEEREAEQTQTVLSSQLTELLEGYAKLDTQPELTIAYEPVWAIGTGKVASSEQIAEAHAFVRSLLSEKLGSAADSVRILYGGSVKPANAEEIFALEGVDGALVGGASLEVNSFGALAEIASK